jgi:ketosteroid isomerase-like protein
MNRRDPKLIALQFNEFINEQNVEGLSSLMTADHTFVDRQGEVHQGRESMTRGWIDFFEQFPEYRNNFTGVESRDDLVILIGHAAWSEGGPPDHAIWTARIRNDQVAEWRIYHDSAENRAALGVNR